VDNLKNKFRKGVIIMTIAEKINKQFKDMTKEEVKEYCFKNRDLQLYADYLDIIYFDKLQDRFKESEYKRLFVDGKEEKKENILKNEINIPEHKNNTIQPIIDLKYVPNELKDSIRIILNKQDYRYCKYLMIEYINYMYLRHNKTFTVNEIEDLYNDSQILSEKELEKAINTVITKGYKTIKFDCFKQERKKNNFDNFQQRQHNRVDFYELENNFFI